MHYLPHYLDSSAVISACGSYRYELRRVLDYGERVLMFVGLNPSMADGGNDDATVRRSAGFARRWGYDQLLMMNLYAYRTTDPRQLALAGRPEGRGNRKRLLANAASASFIVATWGTHAADTELANWFMEHVGRSVSCLSMNPDGSPRHLMDGTDRQEPRPFSTRRTAAHA